MQKLSPTASNVRLFEEPPETGSRIANRDNNKPFKKLIFYNCESESKLGATLQSVYATNVTLSTMGLRSNNKLLIREHPILLG